MRICVCNIWLLYICTEVTGKYIVLKMVRPKKGRSLAFKEGPDSHLSLVNQVERERATYFVYIFFVFIFQYVVSLSLCLFCLGDYTVYIFFSRHHSWTFVYIYGAVTTPCTKVILVVEP